MTFVKQPSDFTRLEFCLHQHADAAQLLSAIEPLQRGVNATDADQQQVEKLIRKLEKVNPNKNSLASPLINGKWKLLYTTSESILGSKRPAIFRANGPIYQYIGEDHMLVASGIACLAEHVGANDSRQAVLLDASPVLIQMLPMAKLETKSRGHFSTR